MPPIPRPFSQQSVSDWMNQFQQAKTAEDRLVALQAIGALCPPADALPWTLLALRDPDETIRALGAKLAGNVAAADSKQTEPQLLSLLNDSDPDVRFESARALIRQKSAQAHLAVPVLLTFLDEDETHALMVAAVLNSLVDAEITAQAANDDLGPRIVRLLDHDRAEVREAVSQVFAKWPHLATACIDRLLPLLDDSEPVVREKIAYTLGHAGVANDDVTSALRTASQDEDTEVARVAAEALQALSSR